MKPMFIAIAKIIYILSLTTIGIFVLVFSFELTQNYFRLEAYISAILGGLLIGMASLILFKGR